MPCPLSLGPGPLFTPCAHTCVLTPVCSHLQAEHGEEEGAAIEARVTQSMQRSVVTCFRSVADVIEARAGLTLRDTALAPRLHTCSSRLPFTPPVHTAGSFEMFGFDFLVDESYVT